MTTATGSTAVNSGSPRRSPRRSLVATLAQIARKALRALANRAAATLATAQAELRAYADLDQHAVDAVLHQIRHPESHPIAEDDEEWAGREKAKRNVNAAQAVNDRLARELAGANAALTEAIDTMRTRAALVVAGSLEREVAMLRALEQKANHRRSELIGASRWWPDAKLGSLKLNPTVAEYLAAPVPAAGISSSTKRWQELLERLCANADVELEEPQ